MCVCVCVYVQDECLCMVVWNRIWKALLDMKHVGLIIKTQTETKEEMHWDSLIAQFCAVQLK